SWPWSRIGCRTVVSGGEGWFAIGVSSKPTIAMSVGIDRPASLIAVIAPIAVESFLAKKAGGGVLSASKTLLSPVTHLFGGISRHAGNYFFSSSDEALVNCDLMCFQRVQISLQAF